MLLVFMQLAGMLGGQSTPSSGGDVAFAEEGIFSGKKSEEKEIEERLKRLRQEDEDILLILAQFITINNSN